MVKAIITFIFPTTTLSQRHFQDSGLKNTSLLVKKTGVRVSGLSLKRDFNKVKHLTRQPKQSTIGRQLKY